MKIDLDKLYVVYKPTESSEEADVFDGQPETLESLFNQVKGGLTIDMIHGIYTQPDEAKKEAKKIWGNQQSEETRFLEFTKALAKLSSKYGIAIQSTGGVYFFDQPVQVTYSDDHTSGDLEPHWEDENN